MLSYPGLQRYQAQMNQSVAAKPVEVVELLEPETVDELTGAQRDAVTALSVEGEYIGQDLLEMAGRSLPQLLRGADGAAEGGPGVDE